MPYALGWLAVHKPYDGLRFTVCPAVDRQRQIDSLLLISQGAPSPCPTLASFQVRRVLAYLDVSLGRVGLIFGLALRYEYG